MNPWDALSSNFDTHKKASDIDPGAADNILIAWPALFEGIEKFNLLAPVLPLLIMGVVLVHFPEALYRRGI